MKERPILFNGDMVNAILDGRKNQTRRVIKPKTSSEGIFAPMDKPQVLTDQARESLDKQGFELIHHSHNSRYIYPKCPYGKVGDVLWVRETIKRENTDNPKGNYFYAADRKSLDLDKFYPELFDYFGYEHIAMPSIHMKKVFCRIKLEIVDIRVERLNDISEEDAKAEGVEYFDALGLKGWKNYEGAGFFAVAKNSFDSLWCSINGAESWDSNPWVWVVEFKRI